MSTILVTGAAGFIGFHVCHTFLRKGYKILGLDYINDYYDVNLKYHRLEIIQKEAELNHYDWKFFKTDLLDKDILLKIFDQFKPQVVINLAAQAGVRYSLQNPSAYINSNIVGFFNILECCKTFKVEHLIYASSSSVYGGNTNIPFSETASVDHPISLYAATKKSNELMAHSYSHLYGIPTIGLRFFTVYGPLGRPDMAPMIFTDAIINEKPIEIFNHGNMSRSFTYIDDVIEVLLRLIKKPAIPDNDFSKYSPQPSTSLSPHRIFNIGNQKSIKLMEFITCLEKELGKKAIKVFKEMQKGDVKDTLADNSKIISWVGDFPETSLSTGIQKFINWYNCYYKID